MENIAAKVEAIILDCLYQKEELTEAELEPGGAPPGAILVEGLVRTFGLHPGRLESHREEVKAILLEMPAVFHKGNGDGMSFLNLCNDKNENLWGQHRDMEALCCLAIGLGMGQFMLGREMWSVFPGGVPYVGFDVEGTRARTT